MRTGCKGDRKGEGMSRDTSSRYRFPFDFDVGCSQLFRF